MRYHNITKDDMLNGNGLRVVLWVSGCSHQCKNCHNVVTWDSNCGVIFDDNAKKEIFIELEKEYINGITLSGGDPLYTDNRDTILELVREIKFYFPNKSIWLYTGYKWSEICHLEVIKYIDILVDGKYVEHLKDSKLKWRGSSNQNVIDVQGTYLKETILLMD